MVLPPERMQRFRAMRLATVGKLYDLLERLPALVPLPRIAGLTSARRRERPLTGKFRGKRDWPLLAGDRH